MPFNPEQYTSIEQEEFNKKIRRIAEQCVWYTSAIWKRYSEKKERTSFKELTKSEQGYYLHIAQEGLKYCEKWEFNPMCPYIVNTIVYPAFLFTNKPRKEKKYVKRYIK